MCAEGIFEGVSFQVIDGRQFLNTSATWKVYGVNKSLGKSAHLLQSLVVVVEEDGKPSGDREHARGVIMRKLRAKEKGENLRR